MKITDAPALITTPFAQNGTRNDIPATGDGLGTGRASLATGFPDETMKPITAGGVPPFGADFNGILYVLSNAARFYGAGGHYKFNADFASKIGGYPMGATVQASDNMGHWLNVVEANSTDPESALSTGWLPLADHNGTATVALTGSATLTPLQAAKANIRFTGSPSGNSTITFPAWTKRYSIINDCTGDQSLICTTGNGESISIKNGAKYEIGCDGKNLTVATVNASQVFAEPNKNVSSLDAPTVQQIINALGKASAYGVFDTSDWKSIPWDGGLLITASTARALADQIATNGNNIEAVKNNLGTMSSQNADNVNIVGGSATFNSMVGFKSGAKLFEDQNNFAFGLRNKPGDTLYIEPGSKLAYANNEGIEKVTFVDGKMTVGEIPRKHVTGLGSMADASSNDYEKIGVAQQIVDGLMLGTASKKGIFDTSDWTSIPWDGTSVPTTSVARSLADQIRISQKNISDLNTSSVDISRILNLGKGKQGDVGYISIPYNNGNEVKYIWIMWTWWAGSVSGTATNNGMFEGSTSITWPIAFPNDCSFCIPSVNDVSGGGMQESVWLNGDSNSAYDKSGAKIMFATRMAGGAQMSGNIFAIGY